MKQYFSGVLFASVMIMFVATNVSAHYASVTVDNYHPDPGEEITILIGFGHKFPADGEMRRAAYDNTVLSIVNPKGKSQKIAITPNKENGNLPIKVKLTEKGLYTIVLAMKNFSTKTVEGYKYQPKNELTNVIHSKWSETISKAVVNVGYYKKNVQELATNDRFQIIPLKDPQKIQKDEYFPVKVLLDNKPFKGMVYATYDGFSDKKDTFCFATPTDKEGIAEIKLTEKGLWLIKTDHSYPYEDLNKADEYSFKATMTFKN